MQSKGWMAKKGKKAGNKEDQGLATSAQQGNQSQRTVKLPAKAKPKSAAERRVDRIDGIKKTVYPSILGVLAGFACFWGGATINTLPWHFVLLVVILITYLIQRYTYPLFKINAEGFQTKDWLYVEFMAVDLWLVTWTLLLN